MEELVLIGIVTRDDDDNVAIIEKNYKYPRTLATEIGDFIEKRNNTLSKFYDRKIDDYLGYRNCTNKDNIQLKYYTSNNEIISKEEIQEKYMQKLFGSIDISVENTGYSEYTITGYEVENFTLGNHNLEKIFSTYIGKYICIIINKLEDNQ